MPVADDRRDDPPSASPALLQPLRAALGKAPEPERYRLLAALLTDLAEQTAARPGGADPAQAEALAKKLARLGEENALIDDTLAATKADLEHRAKQLDAEQQRAKDLERIVNDQRTRMKAAQDQIAELEDQVVAKNAQLHQVESEAETLRIKGQRAELAAGDTSRVDKLAEERRGLEVQVQQLRGELDQLRKDKDAVIEQLKGELTAARSATAGSGATVLASLWDRLAQAKPPLAPGGQTPGVPAAERLFDAFLEMTRFMQDFDQSLNPFLTSFTRHNQAVAKPWDVYARSPALHQVIREVVDIERGKPAGVLKMRLMALKRWAMAAIIGGDSALESIAHELEEHLRGPVGMATDPNRKIRDFMRDDGHQLFHQHIRELRSQKLGEAYAKGV